jgi:hypothetical protein
VYFGAQGFGAFRLLTGDGVLLTDAVLDGEEVVRRVLGGVFLGFTAVILLSTNFFSVDSKMKDILMSRNRKEAIYNLLVFVIFVFVLTFFMRFLWNKTLVKYISVLKPVDSLWHTFLLALGISLFKL